VPDFWYPGGGGIIILKKELFAELVVWLCDVVLDCSVGKWRLDRWWLRTRAACPTAVPS
jgi:hypothetical protein